jgi:2-keto-4-pentenoate hydratase/2-oxohepta-3-ene-1,7-dioic acid hydratase in catechol pathway
MQYSLATILHKGVQTPVIEVSGKYWPLSEVGGDPIAAAARSGLVGIFQDWTTNEQALLSLAQRLASSGEGYITPSPTEDDFRTPLQFPSKVVLVGANYYDHMHKDAGMTSFRKEDAVPTLFLKAPSTSLIGPGPVRYPIQSTKFDWEAELALVIGKRGRRIPLADALEHVAGYTLGIDLSARDLQFHPKHPFKFDLFGGKSFDDSCPLGPRITPARFLDAQNLQLQLWVNGQLKQNANTKDMIWSVAEQISAISEHLTLEPGDVILTGTPAGVGLATGEYLKVGDRIDVEIKELGRLSVHIVEDR